MTYLPANGQDFTQRRKGAKKKERVLVYTYVLPIIQIYGVFVG